MTAFRTVSLKYWRSSSRLAVDEAMEFCKARSSHTMSVDAKEAGRGYKMYCMTDQGYLIGFQLTFRKRGIERLQTNRQLGIAKKEELSPTQRVVLQLMKSLPAPSTAVMDNFFCDIKIGKQLKRLSHGMMGIAKGGSGFSEELLKIRSLVSKKNNWDLLRHTTIDDEVMCTAFQDNNTVQFMSTVHEPKDFDKKTYKNSKRRHGVPPDVVQDEDLPFPGPICEYNQDMGWVDSNAQLRASYYPDVKDRRAWWRLFLFLLTASVVNTYILYRKLNPDSKLTHFEFQEEIAKCLLQHPIPARIRSAKLKITPSTPQDLTALWEDSELKESGHRLVRRPKRTHCHYCKEEGVVRSSIPQKRKALAEMDPNVERPKTGPKRIRSRAPQTSWQCEKCGEAICMTR